jgi:hypothetical protein
MRPAVAVGRVVVLVCAAVLSFSALYDLAVLCGWGPWQAALFPVMVDAGVAIALTLHRRRLALTLLASTVVGNAVAHILDAYVLEPHWSIVVIVGGLAPAILAATWHLDTGGGDSAVTPERVARPDSSELETLDAQVEAPGADLDIPVEPIQAELEVLEPQVEGAVHTADAPGDDLETRARALVATGAGRSKLMEELGVSEHQAKQLARKLKAVA